MVSLGYSRLLVILLTLGGPKEILKTPLGETGCLFNPHFLLTGCLGIQFLIHLSISRQSVRLHLVTYPSLCSTSVTYRTPCHASGHQVLPTQSPPREADDFRRCGKHSKHVPLLTCLA